MNQSIQSLDFTSGSSETYAESTCDLCGSHRNRVIAEESPARCRTVVCEECGLMFASPQLSPAELDSFYDDAFDGDAGSPVFNVRPKYREKKVRSEGKLAARWGIGIVESVMDLEGKRILDLRSRSGALAEQMKQRGAQVVALDPFDVNAAYAHDTRGLSDVHTMRFSVLHALDGVPDQSFDAVTALTQHLLAHVLSPRELLTRIFEVLKPGGCLFLQEKDVLRPAKLRSASIFDTGKAHQFQFTRRTLELYARAVGFEVLSCSIDRERVSVSKHILLIARRPQGETQRVDPKTLVKDWKGPEALVERVDRIKRNWRFYRIRADVYRVLHKLRRRLTGS